MTVVDKTLFQVSELSIVFKYGIDASCNWIKVSPDFSTCENCFRSIGFSCYLPFKKCIGMV